MKRTRPVVVEVVVREDDVLDQMILSLEKVDDLIGEPETSVCAVTRTQVHDGQISVRTLDHVSIALTNREHVEMKIAIGHRNVRALNDRNKVLLLLYINKMQK